MTKIVFSALCIAVLLTVSGCVSYSYSGKKGASPSKDVAVFSDSGKIVHPYQVLGRAVVSGNYQHVSRDKMMAKLVEEAKKAGADAVLIVEQQILPQSMISRSGGGFFTAYDYDDTNRSWGELYRDVDVTIGNIGHSTSAAAGEGISDYRRIIRAEFLRYSREGATPASK